MRGADTGPTCHELLIRLAGRLPDELLWRLRDWLAAEAGSTLAVMLPRELLRHRVGLTDDERELLTTAASGWGSPHRLLDAVLSAHDHDATVPEFRAGPEWPDLAASIVLSVVRGNTGCTELRQAWRVHGRREQRVVLVLGAERPWELAATLARLLRVHGDPTPCVEVLPATGEPPAYHQAAIVASASLWRSATVQAGVAA